MAFRHYGGLNYSSIANMATNSNTVSGNYTNTNGYLTGGNQNCCPPTPVVNGSTGPQGPQGYPGIAVSEPGKTGPQGATGLPGNIGPQGDRGGVGNFGATGATGATGASGTTGTAGFQGATGSIGFQGATGSVGLQGSQGAIGSIGLQGSIGPPGVPTGGSLYWSAFADSFLGDTGIYNRNDGSVVIGPTGITENTIITASVGGTGFNPLATRQQIDTNFDYYLYYNDTINKGFTGTFSTSQPVEVNFLVCGAGGAGGAGVNVLPFSGGGGGGGGGIIFGSFITNPNVVYNIYVSNSGNTGHTGSSIIETTNNNIIIAYNGQSGNTGSAGIGSTGGGYYYNIITNQITCITGGGGGNYIAGGGGVYNNNPGDIIQTNLAPGVFPYFEDSLVCGLSLGSGGGMGGFGYDETTITNGYNGGGNGSTGGGGVGGSTAASAGGGGGGGGGYYTIIGATAVNNYPHFNTNNNGRNAILNYGGTGGNGFVSCGGGGGGGGYLYPGGGGSYFSGSGGWGGNGLVMLYVNKNNLYPQIEAGLNVSIIEPNPASISNAQITTVNPLVPNALPTNYKYYLYYDGQSGCTGTFVVAQDTVVNFFVAGGGGGGGAADLTNIGVGGAGGGVIYGTFVATANQLYDIVVGSGGGGGKNGSPGVTGTSSYISTNSTQIITAFGGAGPFTTLFDTISGGATAINGITNIASGATSSSPGGGSLGGETGGSCYPLNNIPIVFNDGLISGLYFGGGGGGGGQKYQDVNNYNAGSGGNGGVGGGLGGGGGGGGGYYNGSTGFCNFLTNINTNGGTGYIGGGGTYSYGGNGGNGSIACGGGGGGFYANSTTYTTSNGPGGTGGGGIVMLYYQEQLALNVVGNASISGSLSIGGGMVPRYQSGWIPLPLDTASQCLTTLNNTGTSATSIFPNLNFNIKINQLPLYNVFYLTDGIYNPTVPGGQAIEYFQSEYYNIYFPYSNNLNTFYYLNGAITEGYINIVFY